MSKKHKRLMQSLRDILNESPETDREIKKPSGLRFEFRNQILEFSNDDKTGPVQMMVYDAIGKDPWSAGGITCGDMRKSLDEVCPNKDRDLDIRVNSKGGDVHEGMAIRNMLSEWPKNVSVTIDGVAASTASWLPPKKATVRAFKNSQVFVHDAIGFGGGNADDFRNFADKLDKTSDQIAQMYSERTGKGKRTMRELMQDGDGTLMTGEEAEEMGLVDEIIDGKAVRNFLPDELVSMKNQIRAIHNSGAKGAPAKPPTNPPVMTKEQILALLKEQGVNVANDATDEQLQAALKQLLTLKNAEKSHKTPDEKIAFPRTEMDSKTEGELATLKNQIAQLTEANNAAKKMRITNEIDLLISNDQIPVALKEKAIARAMLDDKDEYLNELKSMPSRPMGAAPLGGSGSHVELKSSSFADVQNFVLENSSRFTDKFFGKKSTLECTNESAKEISVRALKVANAIKENKPKILEMWNSNAIDAALNRQVILQDMIEAYAIVLCRLDVFSTVYNSVPLQGTDKIEVPYFPLQGTASTSFVSGTGYTTSSDWVENSREIAVGGDGSTAAATNYARDRKYQMINFRSYDLARIPYLNATKLFQQAANKLAVDIFTDIIKSVVNKANFPDAIANIAGAATFSADDVANLREYCTGQFWPQMGRSLVLDHTRYTPLLKDPSFKSYLQYGTNDPITLGRINAAYGFDTILELPNLLTSYSPTGENLGGFVTHKSAVLVATSPIMPSPEVRNLLTRYDVVVDARTGLAFEYRRFGDAVKDQTNEVVECSYGAGKGVDKALGRINGA